MREKHIASRQIRTCQLNGAFLTLAVWQPYAEYPASYEIGHRLDGNFTLIQFSMHFPRAWDITKRLTNKGRSAQQIQKVLWRLES